MDEEDEHLIEISEIGPRFNVETKLLFKVSTEANLGERERGERERGMDGERERERGEREREEWTGKEQEKGD